MRIYFENHSICPCNRSTITREEETKLISSTLLVLYYIAVQGGITQKDHPL